MAIVGRSLVIEALVTYKFDLWPLKWSIVLTSLCLFSQGLQIDHLFYDKGNACFKLLRMA